MTTRGTRKHERPPGEIGRRGDAPEPGEVRWCCSVVVGRRRVTDNTLWAVLIGLSRGAYPVLLLYRFAAPPIVRIGFRIVAGVACYYIYPLHSWASLGFSLGSLQVGRFGDSWHSKFELLYNR